MSNDKIENQHIGMEYIIKNCLFIVKSLIDVPALALLEMIFEYELTVDDDFSLVANDKQPIKSYTETEVDDLVQFVYLKLIEIQFEYCYLEDEQRYAYAIVLLISDEPSECIGLDDMVPLVINITERCYHKLIKQLIQRGVSFGTMFVP